LQGGRAGRLPPDHAIAQLIGVDKLAALGKVYGLQEHFYIPMATRALLVLRDAQIRTDYASKSASQLAREYRIGERHIWRILSEGDQVADERQGGLFT
jgi:Mor family transcriptional regulator